MKNIVIIGAGDLGREVVWLIEDINKIKPTYLILGFLDDDLSKNTYSFNGYRVLGELKKLEEISKTMQFSAVLAIQDEETRKKIVEEHSEFDSWETIIHPTAVVATSAKIHKGSIIFPKVVVAVDTYIGSFCIIHINAIICNNSWIGNCTTIMVNCCVSDHVEVESCSKIQTCTHIEAYTKFSRKG